LGEYRWRRGRHPSPLPKAACETVTLCLPYQLLPQGYSICLVFLKLFESVYAPLTAGLLSPIKADARLQSQRRTQLDRLYQRVIDDLDSLVQAVGLKAGALFDFMEHTHRSISPITINQNATAFVYYTLLFRMFVAIYVMSSLFRVLRFVLRRWRTLLR
jgi:hypothetical protein